MGLKLRQLAATLLSPGSAVDAHHAVARATAHHPSTAPPSARHLEALLAFGRGSRLSAAALASALIDRLHTAASGHGDAAVALKCLVALRVLLARGAFILREQLLAALARHPASGRNPLALAAFPLGRSSFAAASWVRFSARLLELLLLLPDAPTDAGEHLTALPNPHLFAELAAFAAVAEAVRQAPPAPSSSPQHNALVWEAVLLAEEDRVAAERNLAARVQEMGERLDTLSLADAVELVCVLRRVEDCAVSSSPPPESKWPALDDGILCAARRLRERAEEVVLRRTGEEKRVVRRDAGASASARVLVPVSASAGDAVRFGSTRCAALFLHGDSASNV